MKTTQHTPGPLTVDDRMKWRYPVQEALILGPEGEQIAVVHQPYPRWPKDDVSNKVVYLANAVLFAAAPALEARLAECVEALRSIASYHHGPTENIARALLARLEGEA